MGRTGGRGSCLTKSRCRLIPIRLTKTGFGAKRLHWLDGCSTHASPRPRRWESGAREGEGLYRRRVVMGELRPEVLLEGSSFVFAASVGTQAAIRQTGTIYHLKTTAAPTSPGRARHRDGRTAGKQSAKRTSEKFHKPITAPVDVPLLHGEGAILKGVSMACGVARPSSRGDHCVLKQLNGRIRSHKHDRWQVGRRPGAAEENKDVPGAEPISPRALRTTWLDIVPVIRRATGCHVGHPKAYTGNRHCRSSARRGGDGLQRAAA